MDESLELKKMDRIIVELLVAKELTKLAQEAAVSTIESMATKKFTVPDTKAWARRVISIVKEHSV